jgi:hypothetical protein
MSPKVARANPRNVGAARRNLAPPVIRAVLHWFEELKRLVPGK